MSRIKEVLGYVLGGILIFGGLLSMFWLGVPNLTYNKPTNVVSEITDYYFYHSQTSTVFYLKSESLGLYVANEPINVSVTTNRMDVRGVQLRFLGAGKYFPNNTAPPEFHQVEHRLRSGRNGSKQCNIGGTYGRKT